MPPELSIEPLRSGPTPVYRVTDGRRSWDVAAGDPGYGACRRLHAVVEGQLSAPTAAAVEEAALRGLRRALGAPSQRPLVILPDSPEVAPDQRAHG